MSWLAWGLVVGGLVAVYVWPLVVQVSGQAGTGLGAAELDVSGLAGRMRVQLRNSAAGWRFTVELRPLHLVPIRRVFPASAVAEAGLRAFVGLDSEQPRQPMVSGAASEEAARGSRFSRSSVAALWLRQQALLDAVRAGGRWLGPRLRVEELRLQARFGLGDAAATARAYGKAWVALAYAFGWLQKHVILVGRPSVDLVPSFTGPGAAARGAARARTAQGNVVVAVLAAVLAYRMHETPGDRATFSEGKRLERQA